MATNSTGSVKGFSDAEFGVAKALKKEVNSSQKQEASLAENSETLPCYKDGGPDGV